MGKTESIKERRVDVYLDTLERKERWKRIADEADESLSKFVQRAVEYAIEHGYPDYGELGERAQKIQKLEAEVGDLRDELNQKDLVIEKLEADLRTHRMEPFAENDFEGVRQYDQELVEILKGSGPVTDDELRRRLAIEPTETEMLKALNTQLEQLETYGLVTSSPRGWRWTE